MKTSRLMAVVAALTITLIFTTICSVYAYTPYNAQTPKTTKVIENRVSKSTPTTETTIQGKTKPDKDLAILKEYMDKLYPNYKVEIIPNLENFPEDRVSTDTVYVERLKTISSGDGSGTDEEGFYICYNKVVKQGKEVTSYIVYNPDTNYEDDVVCVVDNGMIRF